MSAGTGKAGSRTARSALTALTSLSMLGATFITSFFATPIIVAGLGTGAYGVWRVILQSSSYMSFSDLGGSNALKWTLAIASSGDNQSSKRQKIGAVLLIWLMAVPLSLLAATLLIALLPGMIDIPSALLQTDVQIALFILITSFWLFCPLSIPAASLRGENLEFKAISTNVLTNALPMILGALFVVLGYGLIGMAVAQLLAIVCIGYARYRVARTNIPWFGATRPPVGELLNTLRVSIWFALWNIAIKVLEFSDVIIVGLVLGASVAGQYALSQFLLVACFSVIFGIMGSILPSIGNLIGLEDYDTIAAVRRQARYVLWFLITVTAATTVSINEAFVGIWIGPDSFIGNAPTVMLVAMGAMLALLRFETSLIDTTLDIKLRTLIGVSSTLPTAALAYFAAHWFGVLGLTVCFFTARLLLTVVFYRLVGIALHSVSGNWFQSNAIPALVCTVICTLVYAVTHSQFQIDSWVGVILAVVLQAIVSAGLFWFAGMPGDVRGQLLLRFRHLQR